MFIIIGIYYSKQKQMKKIIIFTIMLIGISLPVFLHGQNVVISEKTSSEITKIKEKEAKEIKNAEEQQEKILKRRRNNKKRTIKNHLKKREKMQVMM